MTTDHEQDLALTALLAAASELGTNLPEDFVKHSYAIQRSHQFDRDENRETSLQDLEKLVEDYLEQGAIK